VKMRIILTLPTRVVTVAVTDDEVDDRVRQLLAEYGSLCRLRIERVPTLAH